MIKKILIAAAVVTFSFTAYNHLFQKETIDIALTQFVPHPSLDKIQKGFLDTLKAKKPNLRVSLQNAQGSVPLTLQIAQKFVSLKPKMIVAIATPSAMSAYQVAQSSHIPVVFSAVTYPKSAKLMDDEKPLFGITGVSDYLNPELQLSFLKTLKFKKSIKTISVIYTGGETNAVAQTENFEEVFTNAGYKVKKVMIQNSSDIPLATHKACTNTDLIYLLNDNAVIAAMPQILKISRDNGVPVMTSDPESVELGALAALAYDQYQIGVKTAELAIQLLDGKSVETIPVSYPDKPSIYINDAIKDSVLN